MSCDNNDSDNSDDSDDSDDDDTDLSRVALIRLVRALGGHRLCTLSCVRVITTLLVFRRASAPLVQSRPSHLRRDHHGRVLVQVGQTLAFLPPYSEHLQPLTGRQAAHLAAHLTLAGSLPTSTGLTVGSVGSLTSGNQLLRQRGELGLEVGVGELAALLGSR